MIIEQFLINKAKEIDNPISNWGIGFTAEVIREWVDLQVKVKQLTIPVVSNRISDSGLRELYRKGYNDGFDNKADDKLATDLIDKRIDRIKKNYGC